MLDLLISAQEAEAAERPPLVSGAGLQALAVNQAAESTNARTCAEFLREVFPGKVYGGFADAHLRLCRHFDTFTRGQSFQDYVALWPRGFGKTTLLECLVIKLLAFDIVDYVMFIGAKLSASRSRVQGVEAAFSNPELRRRFPRLCAPDKFEGANRAWGGNLLINSKGQIIEAASIEGAARGKNVATAHTNRRPQLVIPDDIDDGHDTEEATAKKENRIASVFLAMGSADRPVSFVFAQNLIAPDGVAARLSRREAQFGRSAIVDGPIPVLEGFEYETYTEEAETENGQRVPVVRHRITAGVPTWDALGLDQCQALVDKLGIRVFLVEYQQVMDDVEGAILPANVFVPLPGGIRLEDWPYRCVGVDPSGGRVENGIVVLGMREVVTKGVPFRQYAVLEDASSTDGEIEAQNQVFVQGTGENAHRRARKRYLRGYEELVALTAYRWRAHVFVETNFGGPATVRALQAAYLEMQRRGQVGAWKPEIVGVTASASKKDRARPARRAYLEGRMFHDPERFAKLRRGWLKPWGKGTDSPNGPDAQVHAFNALEQIQLDRARNAVGNMWV